jgi:hypothetical protein
VTAKSSVAMGQPRLTEVAILSGLDERGRGGAADRARRRDGMVRRTLLDSRDDDGRVRAYLEL